MVEAFENRFDHEIQQYGAEDAGQQDGGLPVRAFLKIDFDQQVDGAGQDEEH